MHSRLGRIAAPALWLAVALLALAVAAGLLARFHPLLELFVHFQAQYLAAGIGLALLAVLARRFVAFVLALGLGLSALPPLWPYVVAAPPRVVAEGPGLRLVAANLNHMHADAGAVRDFLRTTEADIVVLTELAGQLEPAIAAGRERLPHLLRSSGGRHHPFGLLVLARRPLQAAAIHRPFGPDFPVAEFRYCLDEAPASCVAVIALHAVRPHPLDTLRDRLLGFAFERARLAGQATANVIVVGDLNATPFAPALARFSALGLRDAGLGRGWRPTWPVALGLAGIPIDHVLVSPLLAVRQYRRLAPMGSDHYPVAVELGLPAAASR
ncbi:MAG: endonuclease/exonuclease/phosphatase family protein [Reyranellaceae bacterium]